jgi:hypothetical protein
MNLPFTLDQFLGVFVSYNTTIWPTQIFLNILALVAIALVIRPSAPSRIISAILGSLWLWTGIVYHLLFFSSVNPAARLFALLFIVQGLIFLIFGALRSDLSFHFQKGLKGYAGAVLLAYGLIVYPLLGYLLGHVYPSTPTFGAPCPTTIFTFGILLWTNRKVKFYIIVLPLLWSVIGFGAALKLGIMEDVGLLLAGLIGTFLLFFKRSNSYIVN